MPIHPYDRSHLLTLKNPLFVKDLERFIMGGYKSDCEIGDVTENVMPNKQVSAVVMAKSPGVFCGGPLIKWFFKSLYNDFEVKINFDEGDDFKKGDIVLEIKALAPAILRAERTLLNLMQRLCGIATTTHIYASKAYPTPVAATRKTLYGLLDKYAVSIGGGLTHRLNLGDAPLFKENHLVLVENDMAELWGSLSKLPSDIPFATIEIETVEQYFELLKILPKESPWPLFVMFDNFEADDLQGMIKNTLGQRPSYVYFEASGGITYDNIEGFADIGLDVISIGALTHTIMPVDLSLGIA
jgi:nicotinate-nucleotide pyrophosphorylase (carboxylating)